MFTLELHNKISELVRKEFDYAGELKRRETPPAVTETFVVNQGGFLFRITIGTERIG